VKIIGASRTVEVDDQLNQTQLLYADISFFSFRDNDTPKIIIIDLMQKFEAFALGLSKIQ
jgi:hypothetical protein